MVATTVVVMEGSLSLEQRRDRLAAAREAMQGIDAELWAVSCGGGLGELLSEVDALGSSCEAARVAIVGEAMGRGDTGDGPRALTITQWVRQHAPSTRSGGAGQIVTLAQAFTKAANAPVREAVRAGSLPVRAAAVVVAEADRLRPLLAEGAEPHVLDGLIEMAVQHGPQGCRMLRPALLAKYGHDGQLQSCQDAGRRFIALSQPHDGGAGVFEYRLALDVEGKAVLEAALGPLSAPAPVDGERDLRTSDQRRGEALVELVRRAVAAGESVPTSPKAQICVTIDWESLASAVRGAGTTLGGSDTGTLLAPETVRRLACNASILPLVLGTDGEIVDQGRQHRLFTPAQIRRLWLRDGGCTYPGCSMPPHWADAHHLVHWADFGPTDLGNAALLCQRHHTTVHTRRLAGEVVQDPNSERAGTGAGAGDGTRVEWNLTRGSYDQLLARRAAQEPA